MNNISSGSFDPIIIDDFIPSWYQKAIRNMFSQSEFNYSINTNHSRNTSIPIYGYDKPIINAKNSNGLASMTYVDGKIKDEKRHSIITPMLFKLDEIVGGFELIRCRLAINLSDGHGGLHQQHVDQNGPHCVLLYYVNDSDGDTVLYKERYDPSKDPWESYPKEFTVQSYVSPKAGRAIIFDGLQYHSASSPKESQERAIINIDFIPHKDIGWWKNK